ncbi:hypothetical protein PQZ38_00605 [Pelagibacteraceae bacterium]|jgi:alginate O-acetyltransferase complex protein AlgI|nr:hypothetical protein [Pelagibacteraceae bacterium]
MIFSSIEFIIFFLIFALSLLVFRKYQRFVIIFFSFAFYSFWEPIFSLIIVYLILTSYFALKKNLSLKLSIIFLLAPLIYFKYSLFLLKIFKIQNYDSIAYSGNLPLGISFVTFTGIALLVDIKKRVYTDNITLSSLSEFIIYFPQLIAGPILRAKELLPLLKKKISFKKENIKFGILLFLIGFSKKIFFADTISQFIDPIFLDPLSFSSEYILIASLLFPLQIYFDFSGYVDMALGISNMLGIQLPINFDRPYLSKSLTEFWRRWHITLSKWFRDYVYIPLGGSRVSKIKTNYNLILTMTVAGLWHGASWNFVLWGFAHGFLLSIEKTYIFSSINKYFPNIIKILFTCFIVFNLWIVFRISDFDNLIIFFKILYSVNLDYLNIKVLYALLILIIGILLQRYDNYNLIEKFSKKINYKILIPITISIVLSGFLLNLGTSEKFIYFDF